MEIENTGKLLTSNATEADVLAAIRPQSSSDRAIDEWEVDNDPQRELAEKEFYHYDKRHA